MRSHIASDLRFAIRITNRKRNQILRLGALGIEESEGEVFRFGLFELVLPSSHLTSGERWRLAHHRVRLHRILSPETTMAGPASQLRSHATMPSHCVDTQAVSCKDGHHAPISPQEQTVVFEFVREVL